MGAYLIDHPGVLTQYSRRTKWSPSVPTGLTVLHTAESVMDTVGPDTGAEVVAEFIRSRSTPGSYHDLVDSDSVVHVVPYELGAWQDGTGSNGCALSISFACCTTDWRTMGAVKRRAFLLNGARAFAQQQAWLKANGYPQTPLRLLTKAQSDARMAGLIYHAYRDPSRRSDPGVNPPDLFPYDEFITACRLIAGGGPTDPEDDVLRPEDKETFQTWVRETLIAPSPIEKIGKEPRSLQAMIGRLLDDASGANQKGAMILAAMNERGDLNLSDADVTRIVSGLAAVIPDALDSMSDEDVERIAQRSAEVLAARVAS